MKQLKEKILIVQKLNINNITVILLSFSINLLPENEKYQFNKVSEDFKGVNIQNSK